MRIRLVAFGKLKTPGLRESADYYKRIIQPWVSLEEIELKPLPVPDKSASQRLLIQEKESQILLEKLGAESRGRSIILLLDETGKAKSTAEWAQGFEKWESEGIQHLSFCIGSSLGFSQEMRKKSNGCMSLGPQTLPHELARVVLLEQIYRSYSVLKNHPYHVGN